VTVQMKLLCRYHSTSSGEREIQRTMLELLNQLDGFDSRGDVKVGVVLYSTNVLWLFINIYLQLLSVDEEFIAVTFFLSLLQLVLLHSAAMFLCNLILVYIHITVLCIDLIWLLFYCKFTRL